MPVGVCSGGHPTAGKRGAGRRDGEVDSGRGSAAMSMGGEAYGRRWGVVSAQGRVIR